MSAIAVVYTIRAPSAFDLDSSLTLHAVMRVVARSLKRRGQIQLHRPTMERSSGNVLGLAVDAGNKGCGNSEVDGRFL